MIEITGTLNGKVYREEILSFDQLVQEFGLEHLAEKEGVTFKLNEANTNVVKRNRADGKLRYPNSYQITTFINGYYNGANLQVRYYRSKVSVGPNLRPKYTPTRLRMNGRAHPLNLSRDKEEALFWLLFPRCKESPLHDPRRHSADFVLHDAVKKAEVQYEKEKLELQLRNSIMQLQDDLAVQIALGIKVKGREISLEEAENPVSAKVALIDMSRVAPQATRDALSSKATMIDGAVLLAKRRGLIKIADGPNGRKAWFYADSLGGELIISLPSKGNANKALSKHLSNRNVWINFQDITNITGQEAPKVAETIIETSSLSKAAQTVQEGISNRCVVLHPTEDKIYIMEPSGHLQERALLTVKDRKTWKEEILKRANKIIAGRIQKRLEEGVAAI